ncbi:MAG: hypothetical protein HYY23_04765 [Verrucomicrobia bacterium]|nr:hypothetical protein [Verrucomicrobiota bacterium]
MATQLRPILRRRANPDAKPTRHRRSGLPASTPETSFARKDDDLLDRATELGRVLFTQDDDLLEEACVRQRAGKPFTGVIYAHQQNITVRRTLQKRKRGDDANDFDPAPREL